ncbi:AAA family ATPase [Archangium lipolyticum]|uniref:AAA family ATPase n=1 Tax=Archangium lipolyticum TaxID=2970465 RepID=UPI002149A6AB|nr:ATP-binding protein [Archangium lipolyticum]
MQLTHLHIQNFKGIAQLDIPFLEEGTDRPRPLTMLLGDNGSGKTTVLQAVALAMSLATRQTLEPSRFGWTGFLPERVSSRGPTRVELDVRFEPDELVATQELFQQWLQAGSPGEHAPLPPPAHHAQVRLVYAGGGLSSPQGLGALSQFLGRFFISALSQTQAHIRSSYLPRLGSTYWFDQHRNLRTIGYGKLREYLVGWWGFHTSPRKTEASDYLLRLETRFAEIFPGTRFVGVEPREVGQAPSAADSYFLIERDGRVYDLTEMSSGEQAIFPLLFEFVRLGIARSVVLIDELELHLHPPQQQVLISSLQRIGPDCQFIVTSHSPYLETVTPSENEVRLPGGQPCL